MQITVRIIQEMAKYEQQPRTKYEVNLVVYHFTKANCCLSPLGLGVYHTAVQLNDMEFCYCVWDLNPNLTGILLVPPESAGYQFSHKVLCGEAKLTARELHQIMESISHKYTCGKYNMFTNNCNNFSDELLGILVGAKVPNWIFRMTSCLRYLCCCLPDKVVSGRWGLEILQKRKAKALLKEDGTAII